ncbi:hypothetical protein BT63DRAFT_425084 [Microthyrium microscopicum]|uniref:Uncharacterized protein n=1 Tax=Microthyrium microscopicum TaxID=703497 RepID=A0A6A6UEP2_9PEZI|nr:hypothetical protein BT63DRAFT_425084 [Microthyrium microscopicum]
MVFGLLTAVAACPAIIGTTEAIRHGQKENNREEHRGRKYNLQVSLLHRSAYSPYFEKAPIVLKNNKLYVDTRKDIRNDHYFHAAVNYLPFPGKKEVWRKAGFALGEGLVTLINDERVLNWVYVDSNTHELKYGIRAEAEPHICGPWDCTKLERRLTFQLWEGFIVVEEEPDDDLWALYFDCEDDGLTGKDQIGNQNKRMLEVQVLRKEMRRDMADAMHERIERMEQREELGVTVE